MSKDWKIHGNERWVFMSWKMASKENCAFHLYAVFIPALLISVDAKSERNAQPCSFWRKMEDRGDNGGE